MVTRHSIGQGKGGGRKSSITPEKAAILLAALESGLTVKESLLQANLSQDAYDRRLQKDEKFRGQISAAKMKLQIRAKSVLAKKIHEGDMTTVRWFLERKCPEEFRPKHDDKDEWPHAPFEILCPTLASIPHPRISPE